MILDFGYRCLLYLDEYCTLIYLLEAKKIQYVSVIKSP